MNQEKLYYIIGYLLLLVFWVSAWNIIDGCLNKLSNNFSSLKNNKMLFHSFILILVTYLLVKKYNFKFEI